MYSEHLHHGKEKVVDSLWLEVFLKNRLVIGLGSLHVPAQRQRLMTSRPHLGIFFLLLWQIESEGKKGTRFSSPLGKKHLWYYGGKVRDYSMVVNPKNTTFSKAKRLQNWNIYRRKEYTFKWKNTKNYNRSVTLALLISDLSSSVKVLPHGGKRRSNASTDCGLEVPVDFG